MKTSLTKSELEALPVILQKWIDIGLKTRTDRPVVEAFSGACEAYKSAGLNTPKIHIWMESPLRGLVACSVLGQVSGQVLEQVLGQVLGQVREQVLEQVRGQVSGQVLEQVLKQVSGQVREQVLGQVREQVLGQVREQVSEQVRGQVSGQVLGQVRGQVLGQVREQVLEQVRGFWSWWVLGQFEDSYWLSYYEALKNYCSFEKLSGLCKIAENCALCWTFTDVVVFCASPTQIHRDAEGRLHNPKAAAILFPDGWGVWEIHGVRVPDYVIEHPEQITITDIESESNQEIRRVKIDQFGKKRFILESKIEPIHQDDFGTLYRKEVRNDEPLLMVSVINFSPEPDGSFHDYWLRVEPRLRPMFRNGTYGEPQIMTARNAVASTFGKRGEEYDPCIQT